MLLPFLRLRFSSRSCYGFTFMVTKNEFSLTLKLFILFTKSLLSLIYNEMSLTRG